MIGALLEIAFTGLLVIVGTLLVVWVVCLPIAFAIDAKGWVAQYLERRRRDRAWRQRERPAQGRPLGSPKGIDEPTTVPTEGNDL